MGDNTSLYGSLKVKWPIFCLLGIHDTWIIYKMIAVQPD